MTFGELDEAVRSELMETPDTRAGGDPYGRQRAIVTAANEIAQRTDCLTGTRTTNLVANQDTYCLPDIYRVKAAALVGRDGKSYAPSTVDGLRYATARLGPNWQNAPAAADPHTVLWLGVNRVQLFPKPSEARAGGLTLWGFCKPGAFWEYQTNEAGEVVPVPLAPEHECPLPSWAHDAVREQALFLRAKTDNRAEILNRVNGYMLRARQMIGAVGRDAAIHHARMSTGGDGRGFYGGFVGDSTLA